MIARTPAALLLQEVRRLGLVVEAQGKRLRVSPAKDLTPDLADRLRACKADVLVLLNVDVPPSDPQVRVPQPGDPRPCRACDSLDFWRLRPRGDWICQRCHPPLPAEEAIERLRLSERLLPRRGGRD